MTVGPRPPRVLLLTGSPLDGADGADVALARDVLGALPEMDFLWFRQWPARRGRPPPPAGGAIRLWTPGGSPHGRPVVLQAGLAGAVAARRADLVHAFMTVGQAFPAFSWLRPLMLGARPVVHTVPGVDEARLLARTRPLGTTVALSESTARRLRAAHFGDVRVIPPMIRLSEWPFLPRPGGVPTVLYAGRPDPRGGVVTAVEAAAEAGRSGAEFRLVLAVHGRPGQHTAALREELRERAGSGGLTDVEVRGRVDDMRALLASTHVLLFPPPVVGGTPDIPLTILQALATGRPAVLSDLPQFADFGDAVLRAPAGDARRTGQQLAWLLEQPRVWDMLAERGRAAVEESFGPERFADRYGALYRELLA
ncbi:glycosyltransferase family 4 protein [Streptomyces sp. NPDC096030]|uniref:glycosyltransferase family 4 protein n=1 Tax=Streptomyces sp. NPDC096030 TaxID=3155423 RepID=UPI00332634B0